MNTTLTGREGEAKAADYLRRKKYEVMGANYRCRFGELDLIAKKRELVIFVEVKLRKSARFASAREYVTRAKQARIIAAAQQGNGYRCRIIRTHLSADKIILGQIADRFTAEPKQK